MSNLNEAPNIDVPTLSSSAMLVELKISQWTARKKDRAASSELTYNKGASKGAASVNKSLCNCYELDAIKKFTAAVRQTHYSSTVPWSDSGLRLLSTAAYFDYHNEMTGLQNELARLVEEFKTKYEWIRVGEQARMGGLWCESDYPTAEQVAAKFAMRISYIPLPDVGDIRVDLPAEQTAVIKEHYKSYYADQVKGVCDDVYKRVHESLSAMSERLAEPVEGEKTNKRGHKIFRESLVDNAVGLLDVLSKCNVTGDSKMEAMRLKLDDALRGVSYESLSYSHAQRVSTKKAADDILATLPSLGF